MGNLKTVLSLRDKKEYRRLSKDNARNFAAAGVPVHILRKGMEDPPLGLPSSVVVETAEEFKSATVPIGQHAALRRSPNVYDFYMER